MQKSRGFTLIELLIGLMLLTAVVLMAFPIVLNYQRLSLERVGRAHLNAMQEGLQVHYDQFSGIADKEDYKLYLWGDAAEPLPTMGAMPATAAVSLAEQIPQPSACFATFEKFAGQLVAGTSGLPPRGGRGPQATTCYLVSKRMAATADSLVVPYHAVAIVWPGVDGKFSKNSTFNFETGALTLEGDDRGVVMDGRDIQERKARQTLDMLRRVRDLYEDYFTVRFLSDPDRTVGRDYFYESSGDDGGDVVTGALVPSTQTSGTTEARSVLARLLAPKSASSAASANLTAQLTSPWGTPVVISNRPGTIFAGRADAPEVRAPGAMGHLGQVPFTAIVGAQIPGGDDVTFDSYALVTAIGRY